MRTDDDKGDVLPSLQPSTPLEARGWPLLNKDNLWNSCGISRDESNDVFDWLGNGYCSITVDNYRLVRLIRFVTKNYTDLWKKIANIFHLVLHACKILLPWVVLAVSKQSPGPHQLMYRRPRNSYLLSIPMHFLFGSLKICGTCLVVGWKFFHSTLTTN